MEIEIKSTITSSRYPGKTFSVTYRESDPLGGLYGRKITGVHAICFYGEKVVIVYSEKKLLDSASLIQKTIRNISIGERLEKGL